MANSNYQRTNSDPRQKHHERCKGNKAEDKYGEVLESNYRKQAAKQTQRRGQANGQRPQSSPPKCKSPQRRQWRQDQQPVKIMLRVPGHEAYQYG